MFPHIFWGEMLRTLRESRGLIQKELAVVLHESRQTYSNLETGRSHPSPEQIYALSALYNVNLLQYVGECLPEEYLKEIRHFRTVSYPAISKSKKKDEPAEAGEQPKKTGRRSRPVIKKVADIRRLEPMEMIPADSAAEPEIPYGESES